MRRLALTVGLAAGVLTLAAGPAVAHSALVRSDPAPGALLHDAPAQIRLTFSEPPDPSLSSVEVLDQEGRALPTRGALADPADPARLVVRLPEVADGVYTVSWRALSAVDGHLTSGAFTFGIGVPSLGEAAHVPALSHSGRPSAVSVAARWSLYAGLALALGAAGVGLLAFRGGVPGRRWPVPLACALVVPGFVLLAATEAAAAGPPWAVSSPPWLASGSCDWGSALVLLVGTGVAVALRPGRGPLAALGAAGVAASLVFAWTGHAAAPASLRTLSVGAQWLHIVAVGAWIGGLVWLLAWTWRPPPGGRPGEVVARFSRLAGYAVLVVAVTGGFRAVESVRSAGAVLESGYGNAVTAKVLLVLPVLALGALNRYRLVPALRADPGRLPLLRRTVGLEVTLAAGLLGVTGVMGGADPSRAAGGPRRRPDRGDRGDRARLRHGDPGQPGAPAGRGGGHL